MTEDSSDALDAWWNGLTADQQREILALESHEPLPEWLIESLKALGQPIISVRWAAPDEPFRPIMPSVIDDYLDKKRGES